MILNNQWVKDQIKKEIWKGLKINENENTKGQNLCSKNISKKFIEIIAFPRKEEKPQIHNLMLYLKELEKEQTEPKVNGRKTNNKYQTTIKWNRKYKIVEMFN